VNALTDEHPYQILDDIFTVIEKRDKVDNKVITFAGDQAANTARSRLFAAGKLDFELRIAAPKNISRRGSCSNGSVFYKVRAAGNGWALLIAD
jgi:ornithine carbamoyltransferase